MPPHCFPVRARLWCLVLSIALGGLACGVAQAQTVYKIQRPDGTVHYTDRRPEHGEGVQEIRVRAEVQQIARLRVDADGAQRVAVATNVLHGPIEVELLAERSDNLHSQPGLPLRTVVPAHSEARIARFGALDARRGFGFDLRMGAVPGDPRAQAEDVDYLLPIGGENWRIGQGWFGRFSHQHPEARHALDIGAAEGTPVLAAREGVVMEVADDFRGAGLDLQKFGPRANFIRVLHADGSMALYAHLKPETARVGPGARVRTGQVIGEVGSTGFSTGPHLHFVVQLNRGMRIESVPFRMSGPDGPLRIPGS